MESNWRWTAWDSGWANQGVTLCARVSEFPAPNHYITNRDDGGGFKKMLIRLGAGNYNNIGDVPPRPGHPHFPYGYEVDPD